MMAVLNRVGLRLKTVSKAISSGLKPKFQGSISEMARRHRGETNMAKASYLDEQGGSPRITRIVTMLGLYYINDTIQWWKRMKKLYAEELNEIIREREDQRLAERQL